MTSNASPTIPLTQKAWIVKKRGHPSAALEFKSDWPVPTRLAKGEVLVKVQAGALNPVGYKIMAAMPNFLAGRPHIAEHDFAGTIVNANGTQFAVGDSVFGIIPPDVTPKSRQGALAQYITIASTLLISRPENVTPIEAAGLAAVGLTAYQGLVYANLESGQTVFINGGSSGVGSFAIQIAKARGYRVVASASGKNEELVRSLGADEFIDYTTEPLAQRLASHPPSPKFDAVFDAVGLRDPSLYLLSPSYLAPGGKFVTTGPLPQNISWKELGGTFRQLFEAYLRPWWLGGVHRKYVLFNVNVKLKLRNDWEALQDMVAKGSLKPVMDSVFSFDHEGVMKAYERIMSGRARGKVVIKIDE